MKSFVPPPALHQLLAALSVIAQEEGVTAYVVGGSVRDVLIGRAIGDVDVAVDGGAIAWARVVADRLAGRVVVLDEANGVARIVLRDATFAHIDVAQLQGSVEQDMRRRDLTIDAMAVRLGDTMLLDPCGGAADLDAAVVRMNGSDVFDADPLRLLRAVRIAACLGYEIDAQTRAAIREQARCVNDAAAERRRDELARIFALESVYPALRLLDEVGLLDAVLPEVAAGRGVAQPEEHHAYDVFDHNLHAVEAMDVMLAAPRAGEAQPWLAEILWEAFDWCAPALRAYLAEELSEGRSRRTLLKLTALLHDVAKPQCRTEDPDGRVRFFGHSDAGAEMVAQILRSLRFSAREIAFASLLVREHLRPVQLAPPGTAPTRRALYRFYRELGDATPAVLLLALADAAAARSARMTPEGWSRQVAYMNALLVRSKEDEGIVHPLRLLTGHDIMSAFRMSEGPAVGALLAALEEAQAAGEVLNREEALTFVRRLATEGIAEQ